MNPSDKRRKKRYAIRHSTVSYKKSGLLSALASSSPKYTLININALGVSLSTQESLKVGESLRLTIEIPKAEDPIRASGRVAWVKPDGQPGTHQVGVQFTSVREPSRSLLKKLLDNTILENIHVSANVQIKNVRKV